MKQIVDEGRLNDQGSFKYILLKIRKQTEHESDFNAQNEFLMRFNDSWSDEKLESLLQKLFKVSINKLTANEFYWNEVNENTLIYTEEIKLMTEDVW